MLEPAEKRTEHIGIRVTTSERERFGKAADRAGVSLSRLVRQGALRLAAEVLANDDKGPVQYQGPAGRETR